MTHLATIWHSCTIPGLQVLDPLNTQHLSRKSSQGEKKRKKEEEGIQKEYDKPNNQEPHKVFFGYFFW